MAKKGDSVQTRSHTKKGDKDPIDTRNKKKRLSSLDRRLNRKKSSKEDGMTPVWIKYYDQQAKTPDSSVAMGISRSPDYYDDLMDKIVDSEDNLYEVLKQNPESCAFLYAIGDGTMKIVHHLTATEHGNAIVVGLEGFGAKSSDVKVVNCRLFVNQVELDAKTKMIQVPDLEDFLAFELDDIDTSKKSDPKDEVTEVITLDQVFDHSPTGFLVHPKWLPLIYPKLDRKPAEMANVLIQRARDQLGCGDDYTGEDLIDVFDEVYSLLVYLWACQNGWILIDGSPKTYELEMNITKVLSSFIGKISSLPVPKSACVI